MERPRRLDLLAASVLAVAAVSAVGGLTTETSPGSWYDGLTQPSWNPPDWLFGPVWTLLYLAMAVAAWLVAREGLGRPDVRLALGLYGTQLAVNLAWSLVFFGAESTWGGVAVILTLLTLIVATIVAFTRVERRTAWLLVPYLAWVTYAAALNVAIARLS